MPGYYSEDWRRPRIGVRIKQTLLEKANREVFTFSRNARASGPTWSARFRTPWAVLGVGQLVDFFPEFLHSLDSHFLFGCSLLQFGLTPFKFGFFLGFGLRFIDLSCFALWALNSASADSQPSSISFHSPCSR
jgi:hypothetical protein